MTRITVRISVDHGNEGSSLTESARVAEGESARAALRLLLAEVMKRSDLVLPPEQDGEPVADRVNRILPELEDLVARLRTPRPKAPAYERTSEPCSARGLDGECCRLPLGHGGLHRDGDVHWNL